MPKTAWGKTKVVPLYIDNSLVYYGGVIDRLSDQSAIEFTCVYNNSIRAFCPKCNVEHGSVRNGRLTNRKGTQMRALQREPTWVFRCRLCGTVYEIQQ